MCLPGSQSGADVVIPQAYIVIDVPWLHWVLVCPKVLAVGLNQKVDCWISIVDQDIQFSIVFFFDKLKQSCDLISLKLCIEKEYSSS